MVQPRPEDDSAYDKDAAADDDDDDTAAGEFSSPDFSERSSLRPLWMDAKSMAFLAFVGLSVAHHVPTNSTLR